MSTTRELPHFWYRTMKNKNSIFSAVILTIVFLACTGETERSVVGRHLSLFGSSVMKRHELLPSRIGAAYGSQTVVSSDGATALASAIGQVVYVFVRTSAGWTQQARLSSSRIATGDQFGAALALSRDGNIAIIGAPGRNDGGLKSSGAVHVFRRTGNLWREDDLIPAPKMENGSLGRYVSISGDGSVVTINTKPDWNLDGSDMPAAYIFERDGVGWALRNTISTKSAMISRCSGVGSIYVGKSAPISDDGNLIAVGIDAVCGVSIRGVELFSRNLGSWVFKKRLSFRDNSVPIPAKSKISLSSNGGVVLIHSRIYHLDSGTWIDRGTLMADYIDRGYSPVAESLSGDGTHVLISTRMGSSSEVEIYLYEFQDHSWKESLKITPEITPPMYFVSKSCNVSLGYDSRDAVVAFEDSGQVLAFQISREDGAPCKSDLGCSSGNCVDGVCCDTKCGGGRESDCQACARSKGSVKDGHCGPVIGGQVCRMATGGCDVAEICDGVTRTCPRDILLPKDSVCRSAVPGGCDLEERCSGTSKECPRDFFADEGVVCRPKVGACDELEQCTGTTSTCPENTFSLPTKICREKKHSCDRLEYCTGAGPSCPDDKDLDDGAECLPVGSVPDCVKSGHGQCQAGKCQATNEDYGKSCGAMMSICDGFGSCRSPGP